MAKKGKYEKNNKVKDAKAQSMVKVRDKSPQHHNPSFVPDEDEDDGGDIDGD